MNADWWTLAALDIVKVKANVMSAGHWRHAYCFQNNRWRCNASNAIISRCFPIIKTENIFFHWPLNSAFIEVPDEMFKMNLSHIFFSKIFFEHFDGLTRHTLIRARFWLCSQWPPCACSLLFRSRCSWYITKAPKNEIHYQKLLQIDKNNNQLFEVLAFGKWKVAIWGHLTFFVFSGPFKEF